ncbi:MAG: hypothetical protein A2007_02360 [Verrucomicrobia bacterium GWC2_42_7]|nr:MAG: hypothetical protein A2007_02360 [Verrucomicrobia bacterium GWC2_42_7]
MKQILFIFFLIPASLFAVTTATVPGVSVIEANNVKESKEQKQPSSSTRLVKNAKNKGNHSLEERAYRPPVLATSAVIELFDGDKSKGFIVIDRWNAPFGKALPGGKVEYGESVEDAIRREMREELNVNLLNLRQFHVYSHPDRDPRFHCVDVLFLAEAEAFPKAGDDAARAHVVSLEELSKMKLVFDHCEMVKDYLKYRNALAKGEKWVGEQGKGNIIIPKKDKESPSPQMSATKLKTEE